MKQMTLLLILIFFGFTGAAHPQESTVLEREQLPRAMLPESIPPSAASVTAFLRIKAGMSMKEVVEICGLPAKDIGSGIHIYVYELADGSQVRIGTPDGEAVFYVVQVMESGAERELIRNKGAGGMVFP